MGGIHHSFYKQHPALKAEADLGRLSLPLTLTLPNKSEADLGRLSLPLTLTLSPPLSLPLNLPKRHPDPDE